MPGRTAPRPSWSRATSPRTTTAAGSPRPPSPSAASTPCSTTPAPPASPATPTSTASRRRTSCDLYAVNVVGAYQMVRACRALLEAAPQPGAVVNTASIAGVTGIGSSVPYAASKGALNTMTLSLARALAPKIRVNAICPGFIDTPWFGKGLGDAGGGERIRANAAADTPLKVASTAEDIAAAAVFLASPASRHVTGETLLVDAGSHLGAPRGTGAGPSIDFALLGGRLGIEND